MKGLESWVLRNRIGVILGFGFLAALGAFTLLRMPVAFLPRHREPVLTIVTEYHGMEPRMIEEIITRPLENLLEEVPGIEELCSSSSRGRSRILVHLHRGADVDTSAVVIRDRILHAADRFPPEARRPAVYTYNTDDLPVIIASLVSPGDSSDRRAWEDPDSRGIPAGAADLSGLVDRKLKPRLLSIEGVANVEIAGYRRQEYVVELDGDNLARLGASCRDLFRSVAEGGVVFSPGALETGAGRIPVHFSGRYADLPGLPSSTFRLNGAPVAGRDLFTVRKREREEERVSLVDNRRALTLYVFKKDDGGILAIDREVRRVLDTAAPALGYRIITSQADGFRSLLRQLELGLAAAVAGVFLVVLLFYRRPGHALLILVTVPLCMGGTVAVLRLLGRTLNIMTLAGMVVGVGTCVDATILVVDGMLRAAGGPGTNPPAVRAIRQVSRPLCVSTLTTVVVFLPLFLLGKGLLPGEGRPHGSAALYGDFALSLSVMLVLSCGVALFFVPALVIQLSQKNTTQEPPCPTPGHSPSVRIRRGSRYRKGTRVLFTVIRWVARRPGPCTLAFAVTAGACCWLFLSRSYQDISPLAENEYRFFFEFEPRYNTGYRVSVMQELGREIMGLGLPAILVSTLDQGRVNIFLKFPAGYRHFESAASDLRARFGERRRSDGFFHFERRDPAGLRSMVINVYGDDLGSLNRLVDDASSRLAAVTGVKQVLKGYREGKPEIQVLLDRQRMYAHELSPPQVVQYLRYLFYQPVLFKQYELQGLVDVRGRVGIPKLGRDQLHLVRVPNRRGEYIPLDDFVSISHGRSPGAITRRNGKRFISLDVRYQGVREEAMRRDLERQLQRALAGVETTRRDVYAEFDRELAERRRERRRFVLTAVLALFLVYVTVGTIEKSFLVPLLILAAVPGIFVGSSLFLLAGGFGRSVPAHLALVMMVGLSVNSLILLAGEVKVVHAMRPGISGERALLTGYVGKIRLIGVTLLTTVCSLVPVYFLATTTGFFRVLTGVLFCGTLAGTLLSLAVFPALYRLMVDRVRLAPGAAGHQGNAWINPRGKP